MINFMPKIRRRRGEGRIVTPRNLRRVGTSVVNRNKALHPLTAAALAAVSLLILVALSTAALPDLVISGLSLEPSDPLPGAFVDLIATVENVGNDLAAGQFSVRFSVDGEVLESTAINNGLRAGRSVVTTASWIAKEGAHTFEIVADQPFDRVTEASEMNNARQFDVLVPLASSIAQQVGGLRVAVGSFEDRSESGWNNVADGVAEKVHERLAEAGIRTIDRGEFEETMQRQGLNPYASLDAAAAARELGADILITGSIVSISVDQASLSLGPFSLGDASVDVSIFADIMDAFAVEPVLTLSAEGHHAGSSGLSIDLDVLRSASGTANSCSGGLRTNRDAYYRGESVSIGYLNPAAASWFGVEIHDATGAFLRWLGWEYSTSGGCSEWSWDQRDSFGVQVSPSVYMAKIWDGSSYAASTIFQIRPGSSLFPLFDEITIGGEGFEESIVGAAVNRAVDDLISRLVSSLISIAPAAGAERASIAFEAEAGKPPSEGQIAAVLPDGRIAINVGGTSGLSKGDLFEVLGPPDASHVRGEIEVVEVRDNVSYAVLVGEFEAAVGDVIRRIDL